MLNQRGLTLRLNKGYGPARNLSGTSFTRDSIKQFPDCAMMFNVVLEMRCKDF